MATVKAYIASCEKYMDKSRKKILKVCRPIERPFSVSTLNSLN